MGVRAENSLARKIDRLDNVKVRMIGLHSGIKHRDIHIDAPVGAIDMDQRKLIHCNAGDPIRNYLTGGGGDYRVLRDRHDSRILLQRRCLIRIQVGDEPIEDVLKNLAACHLLFGRVAALVYFRAQPDNVSFPGRNWEMGRRGDVGRNPRSARETVEENNLKGDAED
jgi:hypothetical protein